MIFINRSFLKLFLIVFLFCSPYAQAKIFRSSYLSFEIANTWTCKAFGTNWICHDKYQEKKVEALITITAKVANTSDTREIYLKHLSQEKTWATKTQEEITSTKLGEPKVIFPNKFPWVDSIHKNSEVKSYISRYVGTVCCDEAPTKLGILVVLSAHEEYWQKYASIFLTAINSLRVLDIEKAIAKVRASEALQNASNMTSYMDSLLDDPEEESKGSSKSLFNNPASLAVLGLALLAFLILLFKLKKKSRKSSHGRSRRRRRR